MAVPTWSVGQVLTANDVNVWLTPDAVYKPGDEAVTSSTALQNDNDLIAPLAANASYDFELTLWTTGGTLNAGDIKLAFTVPSGAALMWFASGFLLQPTTVAPTIVHVETTSGTAHAFGVDASAGSPVRISGSVKTSSTSGNLTLQWAQQTSNAVSTDIKVGSKLVVQRIG